MSLLGCHAELDSASIKGASALEKPLWSFRARRRFNGSRSTFGMTLLQAPVPPHTMREGGGFIRSKSGNASIFAVNGSTL